MSTPPNKSPGKGSKSLEIMQKRMASSSQGNAAETPPQQQPPPPNAASQQQPPPNANEGSPNNPRKGKDFAAMSLRAPPVQQQAPPPQQQQQVLQHQGAPIASKPKGKDFTAMASRMNTAPPPTATNPADAANMTAANNPMSRAAQMQAEARAAAGMPPLDHPTATTVTLPPGRIPPSMPQQQPQRRTSSTGYQVPQQQQNPQQRSTSGSYRPPPNQMPHPQQQQQQGIPGRPSTSVPPNYPQQMGAQQPLAPVPRRRSSSGQPGAYVSQQQPQQAQPLSAQQQPATKTPSSSENRLSLQKSLVKQQHPAAPHMAPLVGDRIADMVASLDPSYSIDSQAQEQVLQLCDDFLDRVVKQSLQLAGHRHSKILDVVDVQLVLQKQWNIVVPGLGPYKAPKPVAKPKAKRKASSSAQSSSVLSAKAAKASEEATAGSSVKG